MPVAEMLVDSAVGFEYLSMLDGYAGYNQIFIADDDVPKTTFRYAIQLEECWSNVTEGNEYYVP